MIIQIMEKKDYIAQIENLTAEQIAEGVFNGVITFEELKKTGEFDASKQKNVKVILKKKDDNAFAAATTVAALQNYLSVFPDGNHVSEAQVKIQQIRNDENAEKRR